MNRIREYTNRILEAIDEGILSRDAVIQACLNYMSEAQVKDMCESEGFFEDDEENDDDE
jgi:hypothetical protein